MLNEQGETMPPRYTEEFKIEAVKQVTEHNYPVEETAIRLGVHPDSLRAWIKRYQTPQSINEYAHAQSNNAEIRRVPIPNIKTNFKQLKSGYDYAF